MASENMEFRRFNVRQLSNWPCCVSTNRPKNTCLCPATGFPLQKAGHKRFTSSGKVYITPVGTKEFKLHIVR